MNIQTAAEKLIDENLSKTEGSFYYGLYENGFFDLEKFHGLIKSVYELHLQQIDYVSRLSLAVKLWHFAFLVQESITHHLDQRDVFKIDHLEDDRLQQILDTLYYVSINFSNNKIMDAGRLSIENWP